MSVDCPGIALEGVEKVVRLKWFGRNETRVAKKKPGNCPEKGEIQGR
jgi:hypothetical protein